MAKISNPYLRRRGNAPLKAGLYVLIFLILFSAAVFLRATLEGWALAAIAPVQRFRASLNEQENARLRAELASTTARIADRDALYEENVQLKTRLGRTAAVPTVLAGVVLRPPAVPYDTLAVDAGEAEGVNEGDVVSAGGTTLIGVVSQVYTHASRVALFSAPGETYDVLLRGHIPVSMQGQGGGSLMGQVPAGTEVNLGDMLVFPGILGGFVGNVSAVRAKTGESFITLYAHLPVNPLELRFVEIQQQTYAQ